MMPQGTVRRATQTTGPSANATRELLSSKGGGGGDTYTSRQVGFMLGRQVGTAADRIAADQRRTEVEFNAWVRDQERSAA